MSHALHSRHDKEVSAARDRVLAEFCRLIGSVVADPSQELDRGFREIAVEAASLHVPLWQIVAGHRDALAGIDEAIGHGRYKADQFLAMVLKAYDRVLIDHSIYGSKLRAEVLSRRKTETELHAAQAQLREQNATAVQDLKMQTAFLVDRMKEQEALIERVEHQNREQADFTYAVSHDLKSPTNTVMMLLDMHIDENEGPDVDMSLLSLAKSTTRRMQVMLDGLLDLAQTIEAKQSYTTIDLTRLCESIVSDMGENIAANDATVRIDPLPMVRGIEFQVRHLFQNLISNAIKFRRKDHRPEVLLREVGLAKSPYVRIICQDNGIGIAPAYHERIFGLFNRLHTQEDFPGSGLGLALCKRVIDNHGGTISVTSQLGHGSTFEVSFER